MENTNYMEEKSLYKSISSKIEQIQKKNNKLLDLLLLSTGELKEKFKKESDTINFKAPRISNKFPNDFFNN